MTALLDTSADTIALLNGRAKRLDGYSYKLNGIGQYGLDIAFADTPPQVDENKMALWIPIADGNRRDGVGDLLEVGGIRTDRHRRLPNILFDHGKTVTLPIAFAAEWDESESKYDINRYTFEIDPVNQTAGAMAYFYRGKGMAGVDRAKEYDHALFCEQTFHMATIGMLRAGSIGYQVVKAMQLPTDYETGSPPGLHLMVVLMLEGSLVVMPANQDTVRKALCMGECCGKPLSPMLVKSLTPYAPEQTKTVTGYERKGVESSHSTMPLPDTNRVSGGAAVYDFESNGEMQTAEVEKRGGGYYGQTNSFDFSAASAEEMRAKLRKWKARYVGWEKSLQNEKRMEVDFFPSERDAWKFRDELQRSGHRVHDMKQGKQGWAVYWETEPGKSLPKRSKKIPPPRWKPGVGAIKDLRKKYRRMKNLRRRLRKSKPGTSTVYVRSKDIGKVEEEADKKGLKLTRLGGAKGIEKIKLMGDDGAIDVVAKQYAKAFKMNAPIEVLKYKEPVTYYGDGDKVFGYVIHASPTMLNLKTEDGQYVTIDNPKSSLIVRGRQIKGKKANQRFSGGVAIPEDMYGLPSKSEAERTARDMTDWYPGTAYEIGLIDPNTNPSVSRESGWYIRWREKAMAKEIRREVKAAPDGLPDYVDTGEDKDMGEEEAPESYGAQMLRRMHEHSGILMKEYDEAMPLLDHPEVKAKLQKKLEDLEEEMSSHEEDFSKHFPDNKALGSADDEESDDDMEHETKDEGEEVGEADSDDEREETPEEDVVEGMNKEEQKALRLRYKKKSLSCKKGCKCSKCVKSLKGKKKDITEDEVDAIKDDIDTEMADTEEKALEDWEKGAVGEAVDYLKEIGEPDSPFEEEHRMKAYYHHKQMDKIGGPDDDMEVKDVGEGGEGGGEFHKSANADDEIEQETTDKVSDGGVFAKGSMRKMCKEASGFFKELATANEFGDDHRQKAVQWHKQFDGMNTPEEESVEPGEMGEKSSVKNLKLGDIYTCPKCGLRWKIGESAINHVRNGMELRCTACDTPVQNAKTLDKPPDEDEDDEKKMKSLLEFNKKQSQALANLKKVFQLA